LPSVGRTGVCRDNAAAESFFATLKNEMYYRQRFETRAKVRFAVAEYIENFYNPRLYTPADLENSAQQHRALLDAASQRDAGRAEVVAREHVEYALELILQKL
jgi:putative transposase